MRILSGVLILFFCLTSEANSGVTLSLRAVVPSLSKVKITAGRMKKGESRWIFQYFQNSYNVHSQKIELEGFPQDQLQAKMIKIMEPDDNFIQHEILLDLIIGQNQSDKALFLKISAN